MLHLIADFNLIVKREAQGGWERERKDTGNGVGWGVGMGVQTQGKETFVENASFI